MARIRRLLAQQQAKASRRRQTRQQLLGKIYHTEKLQKGPISKKNSTFLQKTLQRWRKRLPRLEHNSPRQNE